MPLIWKSYGTTTLKLEGVDYKIEYLATTNDPGDTTDDVEIVSIDGVDVENYETSLYIKLCELALDIEFDWNLSI